MRVSGRRHQQLQADNSELLAENARLLRTLAEMTAERDKLVDLICGLSDRSSPVAVRPAGGGYVPVGELRASEAARRLLADRLELLQTANMTLRCLSCERSLMAVAS